MINIRTLTSSIFGEGPAGRGNRLENGWGIKAFAGSIPVLSVI